MSKGILYLCATPIGNLEDISLRALRILKEVDLVAAEDTRRTRKLFSHYDIHTPLTSYHDHNRAGKGRYLINQLLAGKNLALVTDAGLPGISDPGEELAALAVSYGVKVVPIPGPSASLTALVVSGLPTGKFCFEGFLPSKSTARRKQLETLKAEKRTIILYEAPHRLLSTLSDLAEILGNRRICIARELTKQYEEIWRGSVVQALDKFSETPPRGEITIVVEGATELEDEETTIYDKSDLSRMVNTLEKKGLTRKNAIKETARIAGLSKREIYSIVLEEKSREGL